jgi:lipopolysaccharide transport system ATP-binding protein
MPTAIKIENVSKQYRLGVISTGTLSHDLNRWWTMSVLRREDPYLKIGEANDRTSKGNSEYVWALKDINMEIEQGDVVGIIGKNGAGKSTLLKLLSRVTKPTTGTIKYKGRIASLLEVGTGFHPEMTGRENIYMNGAIMGMTRAEITRKLDEIVDFSGCERYIDTPVKRYSSGMTVRLGFAIAAHLDPEILVVDEVLAVGDAEFQKKAIGKMQDVSKGEGRTVLFVSHNMTAVKSLCKRGIILQNGYMQYTGDVNTAVSTYLIGGGGRRNHKKWDIPAINAKGFELLEMGVRKTNGGYDDDICMTDAIDVIIKYRLTQTHNELHLTLHFKNEQGNKIFSSSGGGRCIDYYHSIGEYEQICHIPANFFNWGSYSIDLYVVEDRARSFARDFDIVSFSVANKANDIGTFMGKEPGDVTPKFDFTEELINE